jgi:hypothetical protein
LLIAYTAVTVLAAVANAGAAAADLIRSKFGVPHSWLLPLGALKAAGALGLLVGIAARPVGILTSAALVGYFIGAVATVVRSGWYSHLRYPGAFLLLAAGSLALCLTSA